MKTIKKLIYLPNILFWLSMMAIAVQSCRSSRDYTISKAGKYKYDVVQKHTDKNHLPVIVFQFQDMEYPKRPVVGATIFNNDKQLAVANNTGYVKFELQPGKYALTAIAMPYILVPLKDINLNLGDSIKYNVYLKEVEFIIKD